MHTLTFLSAPESKIVSAVAFRGIKSVLPRVQCRIQMTSSRREGFCRNFEVKHSTEGGDRYLNPKPFCKDLLDNSNSKIDTFRSAQVFTSIAFTLGCFFGVFPQDVLAQECISVQHISLIDQGKVRALNMHIKISKPRS